MVNKMWVRVSMCATVLLAVAGSCAAQESRPARPPDPASQWKSPYVAQAALEHRVTMYYQEIVKNQRTEALKIVAPESRNAFSHTDYGRLVGVRITGIKLSKDGSTAAVELTRTVAAAAFPQPLGFHMRDTWKLVNGRWCIVLPSTGAADAASGPQGLTAEQVKERMNKASKDIDPAEYIHALQKAMAAQKVKEKSQPKKVVRGKSRADHESDPKSEDRNFKPPSL
jgi:hypothetical protein